MLTGIDQGEVISPLLWCIYYDALLTEIQKLNIGYNLHHTYKPNVYTNNFEKVETNIPITAYMDDTSYITTNVNNLEIMLAKADSFYNLNNILVNKEKSEILVRYKNMKFDKKKNILKDHVDIKTNTINIKFRNKQLSLSIPSPSQGIRFLGVW